MLVEDYRENYGQGFISLWRSIKKHWIFENDKWFKWWVIMLFEVNHSPKKVSIGYDIVEVKAGQSIKSLRTWAAILKTDTKQLMKFLKMLEKDGMISKKTIGKGKRTITLINISNYSQYQAKMETQRPTQQHTPKPHNDPTNNNGNNYNNENNEIEKEMNINSEMTKIWKAANKGYVWDGDKDSFAITALRQKITKQIQQNNGEPHFPVAAEVVIQKWKELISGRNEYWLKQDLSMMANYFNRFSSDCKPKASHKENWH